MRAQEKVYGYFFLDELLSEDIIKKFIHCMPMTTIPPERARHDDAKVIALQYLGMKVSSMERIDIMKLLGSKYPLIYILQVTQPVFLFTIADVRKHLQKCL